MSNQRSRWSDVDVASMGPWSYDHGKNDSSNQGNAADKASMGPWSYDHGKLVRLVDLLMEFDCFNGAVVL